MYGPTIVRERCLSSRRRVLWSKSLLRCTFEVYLSGVHMCPGGRPFFLWPELRFVDSFCSYVNDPNATILSVGQEGEKLILCQVHWVEPL